jgi:hypothetical protein
MSKLPTTCHPGITFKSQDELTPQPLPEQLPEQMPEQMPEQLREQPEPEPFNFACLPREIQSRIFRLWLVKKNPIHCLSRLDHQVPARTDPTRLRHKFWWKKSKCPVYNAEDPNEILRILLVSKRWYYIGVHCFYGLNTFAFSSLGEFGRFAQGIGLARLERIVNV